MVLMLMRLLLGCLTLLKSDGSLVRDQVTGYLPLVLVSLPISQRIAGVVVGGVMLIVFALGVRFSLAGAFVLFLDLFSPYKWLTCGVSFWLCSQLMLRTWWLTIWEWFVMLGACWMDVVIPFLLSLSLMVIFS